MSQVLDNHSPSGSRIRLLLAILIVTLNLRGAITCVGPLLSLIQAELGLSAGAAGLLTSLPLFAFAFLSPQVVVLARRFGMEASIFLALLSLLVGLLIRYLPGTTAMYLGTALIGIGIAINNVLLPGLLRRDFSDRLPVATALFTLVLAALGGVGSGIAIPLEQLGGWRFSLVSWALLAILALVVWSPQLRRNQRPAPPQRAAGSVWGSPLAWQVSFFMGCQSTVFYTMIAWFPSMMSDMQAVSAARSGWILFVFQIFILASVMVIPLLIHRFYDQRWIGLCCGGLNLISLIGLLLAPQAHFFWMLVMGFGCGGSLVLAMTLFGLRAGSPAQSVSLSGMAQSVGYTMAALVPILVGLIYDRTHSWLLPQVLLVVVASLQVLVGYLAGRPLTVKE